VEADRRLLTRVVLRNYKSIAACDVSPAQLTFLVGPNGSGKSNFLDALRFVADAVRFSLDHALRDRGGIGEVRRRSGGHPNHFGIRIDLGLAESSVSYAFTVGAKQRGGYEVQHEQCRVSRRDCRRASFLLGGAWAGHPEHRVPNSRCRRRSALSRERLRRRGFPTGL